MGPFADVLSELITSNDDFLKAVDELEALQGALAADHVPKDFFCSPAVSRPQRESTLRKALEDLNPMLVKTLVLVLRKGHFMLLPELVIAAREIADERCNILRGTIGTAVDLKESAQEKILKALEASSGKTPRMQFTTDPDLLGGIVVKVKNQELDASLKRKLTDAKNLLKNKRA